MAIITDERLFERIKQGDLAPVYLLYGAESHFTASAVDKLIEAAVAPAFQSFNLNRFDEPKLNIDAVEQCCEALPMMSDRRVVAVKNADIDKLSKDDFDRLCTLASAAIDTAVLIIYATEMTYDVKKSARLKKLCGIIDKAGTVCEFGFKDAATLKRALCSRAKKAGLTLEMGTAGQLIDRCSNSYALLTNELSKLIAYAKGQGSTEIKPQYIAECTIPSIDSTAFDLAKAILYRRFDRAYTLLDELYYQRVESLAILGALNMCFLDFYRAKCALATGRDAAAVTMDFGYPANRKFAVGKAFSDVRDVSLPTLRRCITALCQADIALKSSRLSDRLILEKMIGQMTM